MTLQLVNLINPILFEILDWVGGDECRCYYKDRDGYRDVRNLRLVCIKLNECVKNCSYLRIGWYEYFNFMHVLRTIERKSVKKMYVEGAGAMRKSKLEYDIGNDVLMDNVNIVGFKNCFRGMWKNVLGNYVGDSVTHIYFEECCIDDDMDKFGKFEGLKRLEFVRCDGVCHNIVRFIEGICKMKIYLDEDLLPLSINCSFVINFVNDEVNVEFSDVGFECLGLSEGHLRALKTVSNLSNLRQCGLEFSHVFCNLVKLEISECFGELSGLEELRLVNCVGLINLDFVAGLEKLRVFFMKGVNSRVCADEMVHFNGLINMEELVLSNLALCDGYKINLGFVDGMKKLHKIDVGGFYGFYLGWRIKDS